MLKNYSKSKSGFTIIEVVLVLAIAGLIFLMVFLALPALQRSQRDTQRRDDLSGFSTQITNYQSNNRGKVPQDEKTWKAFLVNYMKQQGATDGDEKNYTISSEDWTKNMIEGEFVDPDGNAYGIKLEGKVTDEIIPNFDFGDHLIHVYPNGKCNGENVEKATGSGNRQIAFIYKLEGGGYFCGSNS